MELKVEISDQFWPHKSQNFDPLTPIFTLKMAKPCKSDLINEFLDLKNYSGENLSKIREKKYRSQYDLKKSKFWHMTPFLIPKMAKSCKSDMTSEFLDFKSFSGKIFSQIREQKFEPNLASKSQNFDLWPQFWPWKRQNWANLTWPVNFSTSKALDPCVPKMGT